MSNPDVPGPYWQDPQASSGRRGAGYGGAAYGGGPAAGSGRSSSGSSGSSGGDFGFGSAGRNGDRRAPDDSYRGQPRGGRGAGPSAGYPGSDEMRDRQRGGAPAARSGRPGPAGDRGRGEPGYRSGRSGGPGTSSGRPPQGPSPRGRGYRPEQGSPQVAQDLRDRLGVNGSRGGPQASSRRGAQGRGRGNGRGTGQWDGYGPRDEYGGRTAVGYADDGYGRTMQRGRPGSADWADDPRQPGHGRRSGKGGRGGPGGGPGGPGGPGGRGGRRTFGQWFRSGDWWRRWTWKKALGVFATLVVGSVAVVAGLFFVALSMTKIPTNTRVDASQVPSTVYFSNGHALGTFNNGGPNRQILAEADIPDVMKKAIIAAEDHNFYHEGGISVTGIIRAAYADLKGGGAVQGGSTLTEQLVKNYYDGFLTNNSQQAGSKFKEILISIKLAHSKSKAWILTQYLNTVYFGHQAYGIGAAAQTYFSEPVSKLTIAQAAMLAAMVNQPGYFQPDQSEGKAPYDALVWRWQHVVLKGLVEDGDLTADQAAKMTFPKVHYHVDNSQDGYRGYLMEMVKQELTKTYGMTQTQLATSGLKIQTTFSQRLMTSIYKAVHAGKLEMRADGQALPLYAHVGAVLERPDNGAIMAVYGGPGYGVKNCEKVHCFVNMAENPKQVGSSFKPYVLSTAVSQGMNVQNSILNGFSPLWIPEGQSVQDRAVLSSRTKPDPATATQPYLPFNAPGENSGPLTVAKAAAISSDPGFEDLAHHAGVQNVINMARSFGVGQDPFNYLGMDDWKAMNAQFGQSSHRDTAGSVAISLGESDLTAVEQTSLFATLINGGVYHSPHVIREILQASGGKMPLRIQHHRVLSAAAAADVDYALSFDNVPGGTAYPDAAWPGRQVIGKTGTTETAQDAWFIGAIPQYSMGVTLFTDQQNSIKVGPGAQTLDILPTLPGNSDGGFGGAWPAKIWNLFMQDTFSDLAPAALPTPDYDGFAKWNLVGKMPSKKKKKGVHTNPSPPPSPSPGPTCHGNFRKCGPGSSSPPVPPTSPPPTSSSPPPTCAPFNPSCTTSPSPPTGNNIDEMAMYAAPRPARAPSGPSLVQAFGWFLRGLF